MTTVYEGMYNTIQRGIAPSPTSNQARPFTNVSVIGSRFRATTVTICLA